MSEKKKCEEKYLSEAEDDKGICYGEIAFKHDESVCEEINDKIVSGFCYYRLAEKTLNPELCKKISDEADKRYGEWFSLRNICNYSIATELKSPEPCHGEPACVLNLVCDTKNPDFCDELLDTYLREKCIDAFNIDTSDWEIYRNESIGIEFKSPFSGTVSFGEYDPGRKNCEDITHGPEIDDICFEMTDGGAGAGHIYSSYRLTVVKGGKILFFDFALNYPNCGSAWPDYDYALCRLAGIGRGDLIEQIPYTVKSLE